MSVGQHPLSLHTATKVSGAYWGGGREEDCVFRVVENEVVSGVLDKAQFGKWGLIHSVHELYGSAAAGRLLSMLSRLLTAFLQMHGFTCGIDDLLLTPPAETERTTILRQEEPLGERVHAAFVGNAAAPAGTDRAQGSGFRVQGEVPYYVCLSVWWLGTPAPPQHKGNASPS